MKRAFLIAAGVVGLLIVTIYLSGLGLFGEDVSAGEATPVARAREAHVDTRTVQHRAASELGVVIRATTEKQILFGDFHVHTSFSQDAFTQGLPLSGGTGSHTVSDACDFARFCSNLDFWSINDHAESSTPRRWKETIDAIRQCDAIGQRADSGSERDLISFVGWEWSHMGTTAENHYGHRNVILRDLDSDKLPTRPIAADSPADYFKSPSSFVLGLMPFIARDAAFHRYAAYQQETNAVPRCEDGASVHDLPQDCREYAADPGALLRKLDEWGFESLVIPHGTTWGMYTPLGSSYAKQLRKAFLDPVRQRLVEIYSGHGNIEPYRNWRELERGPNGERICPKPFDDYVAGCWQAGEIIRERCLAEGLDPANCESRAVLARQHYTDGPSGLGHLAIPGWEAGEWGDAGQCRDCFLPAFSHRPLSSAQAMLALARHEGDETLRFKFGFIGSSDTHTARPGSGYKERLRTKMTDVRMSRVALPIALARDEPVSESRIADPAERPPNQWLEQSRVGSFFYTGGLVAVHAARRDRDSIWNAVAARETYATSGPRILLWFDLLNPPRNGRAKRPRELPMGSEAVMAESPIFRVRAAGSRKQLPGCPDSSIQALSPERLERLCSGECNHPSDQRRLISRIEIVRIHPQRSDDEALDQLIEDPWKTFECDVDPNGCVVTFTDPEYPESGRDSVYYARAIEEPSDTINAGTLRCQPSADGAIACETVEPCKPWAPDQDECLAPAEHRAWSSPIFLDRPAESSTILSSN